MVYILIILKRIEIILCNLKNVKMALKFYVSLPMAYHQKSVRKRYDKAVEEIRKEYPDALIYGPKNIDDFDENGLNPNAPTHPWSWHLGEDIKDLLECDYIYLCKGYNDSKGCQVEYAVAKTMRMVIWYASDAEQKLDPKE